MNSIFRLSFLYLVVSIIISSCKRDDFNSENENDEFNLIYGTDYTVWVASPWKRVLRDTPAENTQTVTLKSAKNEYAPFRLIISTGDHRIKNVSVEISDLTSVSGVISSENIKFFRANYLHIEKPSYRTNNPPGWYPDVLIPFPPPGINPGTFPNLGAPFVTGDNVDVWCDLYIPATTPSGTYSGIVTVTKGKNTIASLPVNLTVWDFVLPEKISMRSYFGRLRSQTLAMMGIQSGSESHNRMNDLYNRLLISHRAVPATPSNVWPGWYEYSGINDKGESELLRNLVNKDHFNALNIPFRYRDDSVKCKTYMADMAQWLREIGYLDLAYVYLLDEPNSADEYETVRKEGAMIRAGDQNIKRLCTEQTITQNPAWGNLYGSVDIWCPLWSLWNTPTAEERLLQGEELWSYTALCQGKIGTPWWQIDMDPLNFRSPFWLSQKYNISGFLYWTSNYWPDCRTLIEVWEKPLFRNEFWGEGILVYPGIPAGIEGFIPSIRLKLYREAMEDYEYFTLAASLGKKAETDMIVNEIVTDFQNWSKEIIRYEDARERIANLILTSK